MTELPNNHHSGHCMATEENNDQRGPKKRSGKGNVDSRFQAQVQEDRDNSIRVSWMETSGPWPTLKA